MKNKLTHAVFTLCSFTLNYGEAKASSLCESKMHSVEAISVMAPRVEWPVHTLLYWLKSVRSPEDRMQLEDYFVWDDARSRASIVEQELDMSRFQEALYRTGSYLILQTLYGQVDGHDDLKGLVAQGFAEISYTLNATTGSTEVFEKTYSSLSFDEVLASLECMGRCVGDVKSLRSMLIETEFSACVIHSRKGYLNGAGEN